MTRTKTSERREAILVAAKQVFLEMGFDRASMDEIAARFGGSKATVYRYFGSKETLFKELISRTANEMGGGLNLLLNSMGMKAEEGQLDDRAMQILSLLDPARDVESTLRALGREALKNLIRRSASQGHECWWRLHLTPKLVESSTNRELGAR